MVEIKSLVKKLYTRYRQLFLYGIIGGFSALLDYCVYVVLLKLNVPYLFANVISVHCGIICSFLLNRQYNFKVKDKAKTRFLSFYVIGLIGLAISTGMLYLAVEYFNLYEKYAKILTIIVVALLQFVLNKFITFRK